MEIYNQLVNKLKEQRGGVAIIVAIIVVFIAIALMALAIDVGRLYATKNELQNVADAAALAGAGKLGDIYTHMTAAEQDAHDFSTDQAAIEASAQDVVGAGKNKVGGENITINAGDIIIYNVTDAGGNLRFGGPNNYNLPDAVRVKVRRDDTSGGNGPITTFFAKMLGFGTINVTADATAALTTLDEVGPGKMNMPIGVSENLFPSDCTDTIKFSPTASSCAGWHNFFDPKNADDMAEKAIDLIIGDPHDDPENPDFEFCKTNPCGMSWLTTHWPGIKDPPTGSVTPPTASDDDAYLFNGGDVSKLFNGSYLSWDTNDNTIPVMDGGDPSKQVVDGSPTDKPAPFIALFDYFRFRDGFELPLGGLWIDADDDPSTSGEAPEGEEGNEMHVTNPDAVWSALIPVYDDDPECTNPNSEIKIVGFAVIHVIMPNPPPDSTVTAKLDCKLTFIGGQGGGGFSGNVRGTIPNLVE